MTQEITTRIEAPRQLVDRTASRVNELLAGGELHTPPGYSAMNALRGAWLWLQDATTYHKGKSDVPVLEVVTQASIANAMLSMVVQGLDVQQGSCYLIPYGEHLTCQRSYFGDILVAKRTAGVQDVLPVIVWEGEQFEYEIQGGRHVVTKHVPLLDRPANAKIRFAYAVVEFTDGRPPVTEIMTFAQVQTSWKKSKAKPERPNSPHSEQPDQMAARTVIRRALKRYVRGAIDSGLGPTARHVLQQIEAEDRLAIAQDDLDAHVAEHANREALQLDEAEADEVDEAQMEAEFDAAHAEFEEQKLPMDPGY